MRRTDLEKQLKALGYYPAGQRSGKGHMMWFGPGGKVAVPMTTDNDELILDSVAASILELAKG